MKELTELERMIRDARDCAQLAANARDIAAKELARAREVRDENKRVCAKIDTEFEGRRLGEKFERYVARDTRKSIHDIARDNPLVAAMLDGIRRDYPGYIL